MRARLSTVRLVDGSAAESGRRCLIGRRDATTAAPITGGDK
jgi:hypothetical protein